MTHFDPKKPCVRRNGKKIVQLVELVRPLPSGEVLFALDETGGFSFNHSGGRYFHDTEKENDLINVTEKVTVQAWAVVERETGPEVTCKRCAGGEDTVVVHGRRHHRAKGFTFPCPASRAPEGLRERIDDIVTTFASDLVAWAWKKNRNDADEPISDDLTDRILALLPGPVMPETPRDAAWVAATDAIGEAIKLGVSPGHAAYHAIRDRLIAEQKERDQ